MNSWFVYWFIVVGKLSGFFLVGAILASVIWIIWLMITMINVMNEEELNNKFVKKHLYRLWIPILLFFLSILTPNLKEMAAIYLIPKVVNNEQVKRSSQRKFEFLELKVDEWIKEMKKKEMK